MAEFKAIAELTHVIEQFGNFMVGKANFKNPEDHTLAFNTGAVLSDARTDLTHSDQVRVSLYPNTLNPTLSISAIAVDFTPNESAKTAGTVTVQYAGDHKPTVLPIPADATPEGKIFRGVTNVIITSAENFKGGDIAVSVSGTDMRLKQLSFEISNDKTQPAFSVVLDPNMNTAKASELTEIAGGIEIRNSNRQDVSVGGLRADQKAALIKELGKNSRESDITLPGLRMIAEANSAVIASIGEPPLPSAIAIGTAKNTNNVTASIGKKASPTPEPSAGR